MAREGPIDDLNTCGQSTRWTDICVYERMAKYEGIVLANRWAHVRRKFFALEILTRAQAREEIVELIAVLYATDRDADGDRKRLGRLRGERSEGVINQISQWLFAQISEALPRSGLGKAVYDVLTR